MLFHVSIDADDPQHVAEVIAEIWGGVATPFPPVIEGSWVALAGDDRNSMVEVYPRGTKLVESQGDVDAHGVIALSDRRTATHAAIGSKLSTEQVMAIVAREGWPVKYRKRGDVFGVLEIWIEGTQMIEVLTEEMQAEYRSITPEHWFGMLRSMGLAA
jgi:hypothetical protein